MDQVVELEIPSRVEYVALARLVVSTLAGSRRALSDERIDDLKLAVSEACTNAVEAQESSDEQPGVLIRCSESDESLQVIVEDHGTGFDPSEVPSKIEFVGDSHRGLGIPLIRTLVDDVNFDPSAAGTSVRMTMYCEPAAEVFVP